jgi:NAD(P)-dependent dehydrogenase (short-subunit alcohol dehydrogenase family)
MVESLSPQSVLITGACGDIGGALAEEFVNHGVRRLALCDLLPPQDVNPRFDQFLRRGARVLYRQSDVADASGVAQFVADAEAELGSIDICIGNAGIVERGALAELSVDAWRRTLDVNLTGCFLVAQAAAQAMKRRGAGGQIILISSWVQDLPRENIGAYCVSKAGLKMLAQCLALELAAYDIRVNAVAPGFVDAGLTAHNLALHPERRATMEASIPLGRLITAPDLARTVPMLCSNEASYLTGTTLLVDGGASLGFRKRP